MAITNKDMSRRKQVELLILPTVVLSALLNQASEIVSQLLPWRFQSLFWPAAKVNLWLFLCKPFIDIQLMD